MKKFRYSLWHAADAAFWYEDTKDAPPADDALVTDNTPAAVTLEDFLNSRDRRETFACMAQVTR